MARLQVLPFPDGTYSIVIDEAYTLTDGELDDVAERGGTVKDQLGARSLLIFASTVDVV
jgi:hypothetical protein